MGLAVSGQHAGFSVRLLAISTPRSDCNPVLVIDPRYLPVREPWLIRDR